MNKLILILFFCQVGQLDAQNVGYFELIRKAETAIIEGEFDLSVNIYMEAFSVCSYPFVKDITAAACYGV